MAPDLFSAAPDCEITTTRIVNFPINLTFKAWTDPNHLKNWWGPNGFTNTFNEFDFRQGGKWNFIMHGPDKGNYPNEVEFIKIDEPNLIAWKRHSKPLFQVLDTVGSGDSFLAGLITMLLTENNPQHAINFACAIGSIVAQSEGANPAITQTEIDELLEKS